MYKKILGGLSLAFAATLSHAALPTISLSFVQPTGVVSSTDSIEMWVHVASDRDIGIDAGPTFGLDVADLPQTGWGYDTQANQWLHDEPFASYTGLSIPTTYGCSPCSPFGYDFVTPGWNDARGFFNTVTSSTTLHTGNFLVGTFVPQGTVAPGTYVFPFTVGFQVNVTGLSASGVNLSASIDGPPGSSYEACAWNALNPCGFTRTVVASTVPEPSTMVYSLIGLAVAAFITRRRSSKA